MTNKSKSISNNFNGIDITSHFQPIFSLSHKKIVGHEDLMRGKKNNISVSPLEIIKSVKNNYGSTLSLDRLALKTHIENFNIHNNDDQNWLFLNMDAEVFSKSSPLELESFFSELLLETKINPNQIVIELLEQAVTDDSSFVNNSGYSEYPVDN